MIRAHQPGSEPIDIPETIPNPVVVPKPTPSRAIPEWRASCPKAGAGRGSPAGFQAPPDRGVGIISARAILNDRNDHYAQQNSGQENAHHRHGRPDTPWLIEDVRVGGAVVWQPDRQLADHLKAVGTACKVIVQDA